jgi:hypothetical protein
MTSAAVWTPKPMDAVSNWAVASGMVPAAWLVRTSEASSAGLRAAEISSWGSTPTPRRKVLAEPLRTTMKGRAIVVNQRSGADTSLAVPKGADRPKNWGTSSPKIIENTVASTRARIWATDPRAPAGTPTEASGPASREAMAGVVTNPSARVVRVMPTWEPDNWVES